MIIVLVHVDDCTIMGKSQKLVDRFKAEIKKEKKLLLSQKAYIESILRCYRFEDLKPTSTPMDPASQLTMIQSQATTKENAAMKHVPYHEAVGSCKGNCRVGLNQNLAGGPKYNIL